MTGATITLRRDAGVGQLADGAQPGVGRAGARLHHAGQLRIERRDRNAHADGIVLGKLLEQIDVARHERVLGDDADRLPALGRDFDAARA